MTGHAASRIRPEIMRALFWAWSGTVALAIVYGASWAISHGCGDWHAFQSAGQRVGTNALLQPAERWQIFPYLPAAAFLLVPLASLPLVLGFEVNFALEMLAAAGAGLVAAHVYSLSRRVAVGVVMLWPPLLYGAAIVGQNAAIGLLLAMLSIAGFSRRSSLLTAVPIGILLYKPTYALPLILVLLVKRRYRELLIVAFAALCWYGASAIATGGDWNWPLHWVALLASYAPGDLVFNGPMAVSTTAGLLRLGMDPLVVTVVAAVLTFAACRALAIADDVQSVSASCLIGLALIPHAWAYDATLALPMLCYAASVFSARRRLLLLFAAYLVAPSFFVSHLLRWDPLLVAIAVSAAAWIVSTLTSPDGTAIRLPSSARAAEG